MVNPKSAAQDPLTLLEAVIEELHQVADTISFDAASTKRRTQLRFRLREAKKCIEHLIARADPILQPQRVFDPSDPATIGLLIAQTMLREPRRSLLGLPRFYGSGVYALYYEGDFEAYAPIKGTETPIYVGKADPQSSGAMTPYEQGDKLWKRLYNDHLRSLNAADNLNAKDFHCRYLVVCSAWQSTAENFLIWHFKPVWNNEMKVCFGFGKHGDKSETRLNKRSPWDTIHPGRTWALDAVPGAKSSTVVLEEVAKHFQDNPPVSHPL